MSYLKQIHSYLYLRGARKHILKTNLCSDGTEVYMTIVFFSLEFSYQLLEFASLHSILGLCFNNKLFHQSLK